MWIASTLVLAFAALVIHLRWRRRYRQSLAENAGLVRLQAQLQEQHRKEAEREAARYQTIFDGMVEGVAVLDAQDQVQTMNLAFRRFLNITQDLRSKKLVDGLKHPEMLVLLQRLEKEGQVVGMEVTLSGAPPRILQANGSRLSGDQGTLIVLHDLTRVKEMERTRKEFVANVSHELRTPISLIKGFVETLLNGAMSDPANATKFLGTISKHTDRLTYLIEDLLTLSRLEGGQTTLDRKWVGLREVAEQVMEDLAGKAQERQVKVQNDIAVDLQVFADPERLRQVYFNLLENAIKYGRAGGQVVIHAKRLPAGGTESWVEDDGPGIPEDSRTRVFERFYRVDRARARDTGGTGLGLAIVKHIVQGHGGEVWVSSELEKGSSFHFTLPPSD